MKQWILVISWILFNLFSTQTFSQENSPSPYSFKTPSYDGIGKVYMGREISFVMGFEGMSWLERRSREQEESVSMAIKNLPVSESSVVADIGAGSGYYTFKIAPKVPQGKIFAVEIQDQAINYLKAKSKELGFSNVIPVMGTEKSPNLPVASVDLAIMVDVYHELEFPVEMLAAIKKSLKPGGKLLLIEYRGEDPAIAIKPLHKMTVKQAEKELEANGFKLVENGKFMKIQHFLVFEKVGD
ncbi:class I SAM-dependent methyltransferase [Algoriphagus sanaruensis]|uniref:Methyltransferase type 11 n=1 Tax=Algoriphagus sanaruensis TaxID=1727163 RepID=A0A142EM13_9BACT|nr:methyltransferase domain-containing protein [Algoriphagus sanaruensis]AMQ56168.1 methyltransferase type 11 [Algoriphagus sanaruensis]